MCGRFSTQLPAALVARLFRADGDVPALAPAPHIAPTDPALILRADRDTGGRQLAVMHWGLVPYFTKTLKKAVRPINARAETAPTAAMFRAAFARRRCLVPATSFTEWKEGRPHEVTRADGAPFAFAGLWESWRDPAGGMLHSFAILTTRANAGMAPLHDRMPVIVEEEDWRGWLGESPGDPARLLRPAAQGVIRITPPVDTRTLFDHTPA